MAVNNGAKTKIRPWYKLWWAAWESDSALQSCSLEAHGLLVHLMNLAHASEPYGYIQIHGRMATLDDVVGTMNRVNSSQKIRRSWNELRMQERIRFDDSCGGFYIKKMVVDEALRLKHSDYGKEGGNPSLMSEDNPEGYGEGLTPPLKQRGKRKEVRDNTPKPPKGGSSSKRGQKRVAQNSELMVRIGSWFNRKASTLWYEDEAEALGRLGDPPEDLALMERYYTATIPDGEIDPRRLDVKTLLNNWEKTELSRARRWQEKNQKGPPGGEEVYAVPTARLPMGGHE